MAGRAHVAAAAQRQVHLGRRGGDRQPFLRTLDGEAPGAPRRRSRPRHGRAQARERPPHRHVRGSGCPEVRADPRVGSTRSPLGQLRRPQSQLAPAGLLSSMAAPDGAPLIEGFEDGVIPPTPAERELLARYPLDLPALERELGVTLPRDYLERMMFHPTLTIRGLHSGFVGAEANTIIPHRTTVAIDIRMVKNQRLETVYARVIDHIRAQGFEVIEGAEAPLPDHLRGRAVRVVDKGGYDPAKTPADLPICREVVAAVERAHGGLEAVGVPTAGGRVPLSALTAIPQPPPPPLPSPNPNHPPHPPH